MISKKYILMIGLALAPTTWADEEVKTEKTSLQRTLEDGQTQIWAFPGYSSVESADVDHAGFHLGLGVQFPSSDSESAVFGISLQRPFNRESIDRYDLAAHLGYQFLSRFQAGILLGLEYLDYEGSSDSNLKPLMGVELKYKAIPTRYGFIALMVNYRVAQGGTGSMLLDGGSEGTSAKIFAAGVTYSFRLFEN